MSRLTFQECVPCLEGCYRFCGLTKDSWADYKAKEGFSEVIEEAEEIINEQKLAGAMSGFFKENIVARHLGIKDRTDVTTDDKAITNTERKAKISSILQAALNRSSDD